MNRREIEHVKKTGECVIYNPSGNGHQYIGHIETLDLSGIPRSWFYGEDNHGSKICRSLADLSQSEINTISERKVNPEAMNSGIESIIRFGLSKKELTARVNFFEKKCQLISIAETEKAMPRHFSTS